MARTRAAAAAQRSWNDMILELLVLVLARLPCIADRDSFAGACRRWRSAARQANAPAPPAQLPWAVFPSASAATAAFSILSGSRRRIYLPSDLVGARLCGSHPGGWLAAAGHVPTGGNVAVNFYSGEIVALPDKLQQPIGLGRRHVPQMEEGAGSSQLRPVDKAVAIGAVAFSSAPGSPGCFAAAITRGDRPGIALCRLGAGGAHRRWTMPRRKSPGVEDVVYFEGGMEPSFHFITNKETLSVAFFSAFEVEQFNYPVQGPIDDLLHILPDNVYITRYLVESRGRLLMVRRYYSHSQTDGAHQTMFFRVFEWQTEDSSWIEVHDWDDRVFFLGSGCSRACELPQNTGIQGSIYFLDDITSSGESLASTDMGVYYKQHQPGSMTPIPVPNPISPLYAAQKFVACIKQEGQLEIKLFENMQELGIYVGEKAVEVEIKGSLRRFMYESSSECLPIWFAH